MSKKYFSISEVSSLTGLAQHQLRYIEKTDPKITIHKIRGRRYYNQEDIDTINAHYNAETVRVDAQSGEHMPPPVAGTRSLEVPKDICEILPLEQYVNMAKAEKNNEITAIDQLITKFRLLLVKIDPTQASI